MTKQAAAATNMEKEHKNMTEKQKIRLLNVAITLLLTTCTVSLCFCMFGEKETYHGLLPLALGCSALSNTLVVIRTRIIKGKKEQ